MSILNNQTVGESLTLECTVTAVRGITSRVDIGWSRNGSELIVVKGVNVSSTTNNSVLFTNSYIIPQLSTADEDRAYQCELFIDAKLPVTATKSVTLNVTGKPHNTSLTCSTYYVHLLTTFVYTFYT